MADTDNLLPEDIIYEEILTRLPVKSLLRFRSVSKTWESVISSSNFTKSHLIRAESDPQNDYLFLHSGYHGGADLDDELSIVSPDGIYDSDMVEDDDELYDYGHIPFDVVGSLNGLVCIRQGFYKDDVHVFHIWNPATKRIVSIQHHTLDRRRKIVWSGMGYDPLLNDYKIICIVDMEEGKGPSHGDIYSINAGCWRQEVPLNVDFPLYKDQEDVVNVNGCPYWIDHTMYVGFSEFYDVNENENGRLIGIMFDIQIGAFRLLPQLPLLKEWGSLWVEVVNWKDSVTAMIFRGDSCEIDYYSLNYEKSSLGGGDGGAFWSELYTINFLTWIPRQCFRNGDILFRDTESEWLSYDCEYDVIKSLGKRYGDYINGFSYIQSLAFVKGMEPCTKLEFLTDKKE